MKFNPKTIPAELQRRKQWVLWNANKIPMQASGRAASSTDPETWMSFEDGMKALATGKFQGLGFVFTENDPYCGIDLDGCRDEKTGEVAEWARLIIADACSYAEVSQSGTGVKIWVHGVLPGKGRKVNILDAPKMSGKVPAVEIYDKGRFFAMTGHRLESMVQIINGQQTINDLLEKYFEQEPVTMPDFRSDEAVVQRARSYLSKIDPAISGSGGHNQTFHAACVLCLGFELSENDAYALLAEWNQSCQPPWSEKELQHKIRSAMKQPGERGYLRNVHPRKYKEVQVPKYAKPERPNIKLLSEAVEEYIGSLESGHTFVSTGIPELDSSLGGGVEFKELVLMAGRPSHGKSAIALQMIHDWTASGLPCAFFSEEMSSLALGKRTMQYITEVPQENWQLAIPQIRSEAKEHFGGRSPCFVLERHGTVEKVCDSIREVVAEHGVRCVVIDYAQLLTSKEGATRYDQVSAISRKLSEIKEETNIVLLALCQLNRAIENRPKFVPKMSDLRETGQLEQDADVIVFGVWPHRIDGKQDPHEYIFFVTKNRNREIAKSCFKCHFEPSRQKFLYESPWMNVPQSGDDF